MGFCTWIKCLWPSAFGKGLCPEDGSVHFPEDFLVLDRVFGEEEGLEQVVKMAELSEGYRATCGKAATEPKTRYREI